MWRDLLSTVAQPTNWWGEKLMVSSDESLKARLLSWEWPPLKKRHLHSSTACAFNSCLYSAISTVLERMRTAGDSDLGSILSLLEENSKVFSYLPYKTLIDWIDPLLWLLLVYRHGKKNCKKYPACLQSLFGIHVLFGLRAGKSSYGLRHTQGGS